MQYMHHKLMHNAIYVSICFIVREQAHYISQLLMPHAARCIFIASCKLAFKVVGFMLGIKSRNTKYPCFMCLCDSRADTKRYIGIGGMPYS